MRFTRALATALLLALAAAVSASAQARAKVSKDKSGGSSPMADGQVRRIDREAGRITIKHGPIKSDTLEMDAMTMVFQVKDKAQLDAIKDGDKVRFRVVSDEGGRMTITEIEPAR